jgi:hypothetical protein
VLLTGVAAKELLLCATLPWIVLLIVRAFDGLRARLLAATAGLLIGLCALVQPSAQLLPALMPVYGWIRRARAKQILILTLLMAGAMAIAIAPWTFRNFLAFGTVVPIATNGGSNLYRANNALATGGYTTRGEIDLGDLPELSADREGKRLAREWIVNNPAAFLQLAWKKQLLFLGDDSAGAYYSLKTATLGKSAPDASPANSRLFIAAKAGSNVFWLSYWILLFAAMAHVVGSRRVIPDRNLLVPLVFLYFFAIHSVFESNGRYHVPLLGTLCVMLPALWGKESTRS